jgi:hypothetical protein
MNASPIEIFWSKCFQRGYIIHPRKNWIRPDLINETSLKALAKKADMGTMIGMIEGKDWKKGPPPDNIPPWQQKILTYSFEWLKVDDTWLGALCREQVYHEFVRMHTTWSYNVGAIMANKFWSLSINLMPSIKMSKNFLITCYTKCYQNDIFTDFKIPEESQREQYVILGSKNALEEEFNRNIGAYEVGAKEDIESGVNEVDLLQKQGWDVAYMKKVYQNNFSLLPNYEEWHSYKNFSEMKHSWWHKWVKQGLVDNEDTV